LTHEHIHRQTLGPNYSTQITKVVDKIDLYRLYTNWYVTSTQPSTRRGMVK